MIVIKGIAASPGIAMGKAFLLDDEDIPIERIRLPPELLRPETRRFKAALKSTLKDLDQTESKILRVLGKQHARLIDAHRLILDDPLITQDVPQRILKEGVNAEYALSQALAEISSQFEKMKDEFFRERRHDLNDVGKRLLTHLTRKPRRDVSMIDEPSIVLARNLLPSETLALPKAKVLGFATDLGGKSSHTAILAQSLNIPAVVGLSDVSRRVRTGDQIILDGAEGLLIIHPGSETLLKYTQARAKFLEEETALVALKDLPAVTQDGRRLRLEANLDSPDDLKGVASLRPDGIGLFRTESLYLNVPNPPAEDKQALIYSSIVKSLSPKPVTIRTADLGADRLVRWGLEAPPNEPNPFLGLRGIRLSLKHFDLFKTQMRAILRASSVGPLRIMIPMISSPNEMSMARQVFLKARAELEAEGLTREKTSAVELGMMVEVPSAALLIESFLPLVDFLSVGTNDLIQYTLAVDRINESVSHLYDPFHPAVLQLLARVISAAHAQKKPVGICGEMTADPQAIPYLIGLGFDSLSVPARMFLRVKKTVRAIRHDNAKRLVEAALKCSSPEEVRRLAPQVSD